MDQVIQNFFNLEILIKVYPLLLAGFWMTIKLCLVVVTLGVIGGLTVNLVTTMAALFLLLGDHVVAALVVGYAFAVPYNAIFLVGVWRSASSYACERRWADWARIVTLIAAVVLSLT